MKPVDRTASTQSPGFADLAESIRRAILRAGEAAYEDAGIQGLCAEGRWEAAVAAMRAVNLAALSPSADTLARGVGAGDPPSTSGTG
jgi:hypothetical protein